MDYSQVLHTIIHYIFIAYLKVKSNILLLISKSSYSINQSQPTASFRQYILDNIYTIICSIVFCLLLIIIIIRCRSPFWSRQPVFHIYNIHNLLYNAHTPGTIIQKTQKNNEILPRSLQYENYINIHTLTVDKINDRHWKSAVDLLSEHYLNTDHFNYSPTIKNLVPYLQYHQPSVSCLSYYLKNNEFIGLITSRPLQFEIINKKKYNLYYVDFLCVHKKHRGKNIAPTLIQMHECNQRKNHNLAISLFKKEGALHSTIIPLCVYENFMFDISKFNQKNGLQSSYTIILISKETIYLFYEFMTSNKAKFKCVIQPTIYNIEHLIETQNLFVFMLFYNKQPISFYIFRNTATLYKNQKTIEFMASLNSNNAHNDAFIVAFRDIVKANFPKYLLLFENLSHNCIIYNNLKYKHRPIVKNKNAYYLYNYALHSFLKSEVLIIS